jgi:hypothetical protein
VAANDSIARDLIADGRYVFPLRAHSKHPLANCPTCSPKAARCRQADVACPCWPGQPCHAHRAATLDPAAVAAWWTRWPAANVGISTGPSQRLIVDLDAKSGHPTRGELLPAHLKLGRPAVTSGVDLWRYAAAELAGEQPTPTRTVRTPTGGYHLVYAVPAGVRYTSSAGRVHQDGHVTGLGWSIDVRSDGGYVVAPGSTTRDGTYTVVRDVPILQVPAWLDGWLTSTGHRVGTQSTCLYSPAGPPTAGDLAKVAAFGEFLRVRSAVTASRAERYALAALDGECARLAAMPPTPGGRKDQLNRSAYKMGGYVTAGAISEQTVTDALTAAAEACQCPRIEHNIQSGLAAGMRRPRSLAGGVA